MPFLTASIWAVSWFAASVESKPVHGSDDWLTQVFNQVGEDLGVTPYRAFWPKAPSIPMSDALNAATKYIATHRPESIE